MSTQLTHEQRKGNMLREFDGLTKLAAICPDFVVDVVSGRLGEINGGDYNTARSEAKTMVTGFEMMAKGTFGFDRAAKAVQPYFAPTSEPQDCDEDETTS